jgi:hypothetical protein
VIIARSELVSDDRIGQLDASLAARIGRWSCWSRKRIINAVDAAVRAVDPDAAKERRVRADDDRHLSITALPNGTAQVRGTLPATAGAAFDAKLSQMATSVCAKDSRTIAQRRADAASALVEGRALACDCGQADCPARASDGEPGPGAVRTVINVIATESTLAGDVEQPGYLKAMGSSTPSSCVNELILRRFAPLSTRLSPRSRPCAISRPRRWSVGSGVGI